MNLKLETSNFLNDLERVAALRREIADRLSNIAQPSIKAIGKLTL